MSVQINGERKGIEISWDPSGGIEEPPDKPPDFPDGIWGGANEPFPTPPIELPPDILDGVTDEELKEKLKEKILAFALGNLPPYEGGPTYPAPVSDEGTSLVKVFGQGQEGDWHNSPVTSNDGLASLSYPKGFTGSSYIEVRDANDGSLIDAGVISVA